MEWEVERKLDMRTHTKIGFLLNCSLTLVFASALAGIAAAADQASLQTQAGVQIDIPADAPVHIINFGLDPSPAGMTAFHYDVRNVSGQGLVAVEIRWQMQFGERPGSVISNRDDRWLTGQLAPGASEHFQVTNVAGSVQPTAAQHSAAAQPATRLVAWIAYAELEDGSRQGLDSAKVGEEITNARRAQLSACTKLLEAFGTGGGEGLAQALRQSSAAGTQDPAAQELTARMLSLLTNQGPDAVVLELQRISTLSVPEIRS